MAKTARVFRLNDRVLLELNGDGKEIGVDLDFIINDNPVGSEGGQTVKLINKSNLHQTWDVSFSGVLDQAGTPVGSTATAVRDHLSTTTKGFGAGSGGSGSGTNFTYTATNYTDLTTVVAPTATEGELAIVYNSQGIWLINRKLKGVYIYQSGVWEYANQELQDILEGKVDSVTGDLVDNTDPLNPVVNTPWYPWSMPLGSFRANGASEFAATGAGHLTTFGANSDDEIVGNYNLIQNGVNYDGSSIIIDLHWQLFSAPGGGDNVLWEMDYAFLQDGEDNFAVSDGTISLDVDVSARNNREQYTDQLPSISGPANSTGIQITLRRNGQGAGSDSYGGDADLYDIVPKKL